jgi:hypothetical protein
MPGPACSASAGKPLKAIWRKKSQHAIDSAMDTIKAMADRVQAVMHHVTEPPTQVEVTFGLTLEAEAGALIAKAKTGATIEVSMTWEREH